VAAQETTPCQEDGECPRVFFLTKTGEVVSQGYAIDAEGMAVPPEGERQHRMDLAAWRALNEQVEALAAQSDPYATFTHSAFRLETLPQYLVESEREEFAAFLRGEPVPVPSTVETSPWFRQMAAGTKAGKRWHRVHVVERPLSDYLRWEIAAYSENVLAGEDIRIADLGDHPELRAFTEDFWLFDAETDHPSVTLMRYDAEGHPLVHWRTRDPEIVAECIRQRDLALAASVSLEEFRASLSAPPTPAP